MLFLTMITLSKSSNANIYDKCVNTNHITLTFDDGPHENTLSIMSTLDKKNISGAFFVNMLNAVRDEKMSNIVSTIYSSNHILASHGFSHAAMEKLNLFNKERELYDNEFMFRKLFNKRPRFFRPPYFNYDEETTDVINRFGYDIILSNLNTDDWMMDSSLDIYNSFVSKWNNYTGHIMLMHDYQIHNIDALEQIIKFVEKENYEFVSLSECIGVDGKYVEDNTYGPYLLNGFSG